MITLKVYGTNGSIPGGNSKTKKELGCNTSCYGIFFEDQAIILDAGSGLIEASKETILRGSRTTDILLSHYHHDHICGFLIAPFSYFNPNGTKIKVTGPPFLREALNAEFGNFVSPGSYQIMRNITELNEAIPGEEFTQGDIRIHAFAAGKHPLFLSQKYARRKGGKFYQEFGVLGWNIEIGDAKISYATDMEFDAALNPEGHVQEFNSIEKKRRELLYLNAIERASILIADTQYTFEEYPQFKGFGHTYPERVMGLAREAGVERVILSHHMPIRTDAEIRKMEHILRRKYPEIDLRFARESEELKLEEAIRRTA